MAVFVLVAALHQQLQSVPLLQQRLLQAALSVTAGVQCLDQVIHLFHGAVEAPPVVPLHRQARRVEGSRDRASAEQQSLVRKAAAAAPRGLTRASVVASCSPAFCRLRLHLLFLQAALGVQLRALPRLQHLLRQAKAVILHKQGGG